MSEAQAPTTPVETTSSPAPSTLATGATAPVAPASTPATAAAPAGEPTASTEPGKATDAAPGEAAPGAPQGAPETYEFAAPEGAPLGESVVTAFSEVARELNLPQDAAQKVIDKVAPAIAAHQAAELERASGAWVEAAKSDKEFGGDAFDANLAIARKAVDTFAPPALREMLVQSRLGNHPEFIRMMVQVGKAMSEDGIVQGKAAPEKVKPASVMGLATSLYE